MCKNIFELMRLIGNGFEGFGVGSFIFSRRDLSECSFKSGELNVILSMSLNNVCNFNCRHCIAADTRKLSDCFDKILNELQAVDLSGVKMVSFSGLEPLETPDRVLVLADFFHEKGIATVLMTNANLLSAKIRDFLWGRIDFFDPSIDGLRGTCKPALKNGGVSPAWKNIMEAVETGFAKKTGIIVTVREENIKELPDLLDFFRKEIGVSESVKASFSFYLGEKILLEKTFLKAMEIAIASSFAKNILIPIPGEYMDYLPALEKRFDLKSLRHCSLTGISSYMIEEVQLLLPSFASRAALIKINSDGSLYLGRPKNQENFLGPITCLGEIL